MTALLLAAMALGADPAPAAFVLEVSGTVTVEKGGMKVPLEDGDPLRPGDKVTVAAGGALKAFFKSSNSAATLSGPSTAEVKAGAFETAGKVTVKETKLSAKAAEGLDREKANLIGGMTLRPFAPDEPPALKPVVDSAILGQTPPFEWPAVEGATSYQVEVVSGASEKQERPVWKKTSTDRKLAFPEGERPLARGGVYRWRVTAVLADGSTKSAVTVGRFAVLDEQSASALSGLESLEKSEDPTDWLLAARAYAGWRLHDESVRMYERIAAQRPESASAWKALGKFYRQAGQIERAREAEAKAAKSGG